MHNLHVIDICIIAGYLILCLAAGLLQINKVGNIREYAVGTGRVSTPLLVSTIFATYMGAGSLIGSVEKIYSLGLLFIVAIMFEPILWVVTSKLFANYIGTFKKKGCITISDIMEVLNTHAPILISIYATYTLAILLAILLFLKRKDLLQSEQLDTRLVYSNAVAHEVKNPLIGAAMIADFLHDTFKDKTHPKQLSETDFSQIKEFIPAFRSSNKKALSTIDRILNAVRIDADYADDIQIYDINTCVQGAINACSLTEEEQARVQVNHEGGFFFKGSKHFTIHVIINLLNNSFKYAGSSATI